jgi:YhcH/YjgK/YiaL family protein
MIIDILANSHLYRGLSPGIDRAFDYLHQTDLSALELGDHEIDGEKIYARVLTYTTRPMEQGVWEAHRRYLDLQVIVEGQERICYAPLNRLVHGDYTEAKDFWQLSGNGDALLLLPGGFMLLWPTDGHMPNLATEAPAPVKKVVVKIAV